MRTTAELRWFDRDTIPNEIKHWFQHNCLGEYLGLPEEREDLYLSTSGCDYLSLKLRQKRLEVKWRQAELGVMSFGDAVEGKAERWVKWSTDTTADRMISQAAAAQEQWVSVQKVRSQRQYQVSSNTVTAVPINEFIDRGCSAELTQLNINGNAWWSLAFEAFGEDDCSIYHLQAVANWVFQTYRGPKLQVRDSYAYPSWLSIVF